MGSSQARRLLLDAGLSPDRLEPLARQGRGACAVHHRAHVVDTPSSVAGADVVVSPLENGTIVTDVLFAADGAGLVLGAVVDMSPIKPAEAQDHARHLAERGIHSIDAPAGECRAEQGTSPSWRAARLEIFARPKLISYAAGRPAHVGRARRWPAGEARQSDHRRRDHRSGRRGAPAGVARRTTPPRSRRFAAVSPSCPRASRAAYGGAGLRRRVAGSSHEIRQCTRCGGPDHPALPTASISRSVLEASSPRRRSRPQRPACRAFFSSVENAHGREADLQRPDLFRITDRLHRAVRLAMADGNGIQRGAAIWLESSRSASCRFAALSSRADCPAS